MVEAINTRLKSQVQSYSAGRGVTIDLTSLKKTGTIGNTQHVKMDKGEVDRLKSDIFALQRENHEQKQDFARDQ